MRQTWVLYAIGAVIGLLAIPLSNLLIPSPTRIPKVLLVRPNDSVFNRAAPIFEQKCLDCHSTKTRYPWYFRMPVVRDVMSRDVARGTSHIDLMHTVFETHNPSERDLAKIEAEMYLHTMPPPRYLALHWNAAVSNSDREAILDWIHHVRAERADLTQVNAEFAGEPIQPLQRPGNLDAQKVALGRALFHDTRLSGDNTLSCASCHGLNKGGTDQSKTATGINHAVGPINVPTVYNASLNFVQFWDGRAPNLQEQANGPVNNPIEMGGNWPDAIKKLQADPQFVSQFQAAYPGESVTSDKLTHSIATFERSLITPNSRFDRYLKGDKTALSDDERKGYKLFKETGCISCHHGPGLGGNGYEKMGKMANYFKDRGHLTPADYGRFNVTKNEADRYVFKVPLLRNVAKTYPYFHDGSTSDLTEAVKIMARYQLGKTLPDKDAQDIAKFLESLTGEYEGKALK